MEFINGIEELNKSLCEEAQISIINHQQFKLMHYDKGSKFERLVAHINYVTPLNDGYQIILDNGKVICAYFNGECTIGDKHANHIDFKSGHNRLVINNNSLVVEKLILTAKAVYDNALPVSFKGLCVNVKDGSGSIFTAMELGIQQNFRLNNLEWTLNSRNLVHGRYIKKLHKIVGKAIRFSANDLKLYQLLQLKNKVAVQNYVAENY